MSLVLYFVFALAFLAALATMIVKISHALGDSPQTVRAARAAGVSIVTGYSAIGCGAVTLIGSALMIAEASRPATLFAIGLAALVLGIGFILGVTILRYFARPLQAAGLVDAPQVAAPVAAVQV